jgi:hypothetical protein
MSREEIVCDRRIVARGGVRFGELQLRLLRYPLRGIVEKRLLSNAFAVPALVSKFFHMCGCSILPFKMENPPDDNEITI